MSGDIEEMFTVRKAAKVLGGVSPTSVRRLIEKGRKTKGEKGIWPVYRLPGLLLIPPSAVSRYLERHTSI